MQFLIYKRGNSNEKALALLIVATLVASMSLSAFAVSDKAKGGNEDAQKSLHSKGI
jgi:hypothetical protein